MHYIAFAMGMAVGACVGLLIGYPTGYTAGVKDTEDLCWDCDDYNDEGDYGDN